MADKKLVLSPEQTDQVIIYKVENGLRVTPEERARYEKIKNKPAADKKAAQYTEQMQKGRSTDADTAQQYYESKNKIRNINPTADAVTIKQVEPKTASKFDTYLANVQMLRAQRAKLLQNRGKMPPAEFDKQLAYIDDAIERIRRAAQDEGVYEYATTRRAFTPNVYRDYAYLIGHDDAYDLTAFDYMEPKSSPSTRYEDPYPRGLQVYDAQLMYNKMDPVKAAGTYIKALWAEYNAANSFNKVFTASGYPEGYDFSNDKTPYGKQLRKAYDNYIKNKDDFEIATVAVKQKLAASDDTYVNQFLKSFYERCKSEIALSPEDESYVEEVLRSLDPTAYDESTHATSNKEIMSEYDQAKREMEGV